MGLLRRRLAAVLDALRAFETAPRVLRLVWRAHPSYALAALALNAAQGISPVLHGWLSKLVVDAVAAAVTGAADPSAALPYVAALVAARTGYALLDAAQRAPTQLVWQQLGDFVTRDVQALILRKAAALRDIAFFESARYHDLLERARNDAGSRPINLVNGLLTLFRTALTLVAAGAVLFALQPLLPVLLAVCALPQLVVQFRQRREIWSLNDSGIPEVRWMGYLRRVLTDRAEAKEVRLFGLGGYFLDEHRRAFDAYRAGFSARRWHHWRWNSALALLGTGAAVGSYAYVVVLAVAGRISVGDVVLYTAALGSVQGALEGLVWQAAAVYEGSLFAGNVFAFLDLPAALPERPRGEARRVPTTLRAGVELRGVGFAYPGSDRPVLRNVGFAIRPGETVALVGENGAGKTTIVKLLTRLYDPTEGHVLLDGVDLREYDLDEWRRRIAVVFQDFARYDLLARENIGVGNVPRVEDLAAVRAAAQRGGADELVARLPQGFETMLGRRFRGPAGNGGDGHDGVEPSGGEWQKIALARAFMRVPPDDPDCPTDPPDPEVLGPGNGAGDAAARAQLLILDEPTAALDARAEHELYLRFRELTRGRSTLLISHRFSTVRMADRIVVLDNGGIVEQGSHDELAARGGRYARLYALQAERYR